MTDAFSVDELHAPQDLDHEILDLIHLDKLALLLRCLDYLLQILLTELEDEVLHHLALLVFRVVDVQELDYVFTATEAVENFKLARDVLTALASALNCYRFSRVRVYCFKYISYNNKKSR